MRTRALLFGLLFFGTAGCGGARAGHAVGPAGLTADQIDGDPTALLPARPVAVANVDARAFYSSATIGAGLAAMTERVMPTWDDAGFKASRDVDRVVAATYSTQGADFVAILRGRFDEAKIDAAAEDRVQRSGGTFVRSDYAGHHVFTTNGGGFTVLTPKTALVGTEAVMRRSLDRVRDGAIKPELDSWMQDTLATPSAAAALAVNFAQPVTSAAISSFNLSFVKGLTMVRALADFKPPGMHLAGTLTYADADAASSAANGMKAAVTLEGIAAITGLVPKLHDVSIVPTGTNVEVSMAVDDQGMQKMIAVLPQVVR